MGFSVLVMNSKLLFADSLTSTLLDWLGYATDLPVLARLHSHIQLLLESVLSLYFPASMMLEVMYQSSLTSKRSSINPEPRQQLVLPAIDGASLLVEQINDKFSQIFFEALLVRISLISVKTVLMCNDFLLWSVVETRLSLQEGLLELLHELGWYLAKVGVLRTWSPPTNFDCPSAFFFWGEILPILG